MSNPSTKKEIIIVLMVLIFCSRLFQINDPIVDHHSWNQISAASMAKHLYYDWSTFFSPTVDLYGSPDSTSTVYAQEMLLYHLPIALLYHLFGVAEWAARLVSITYGMIGLWYLFLLSKRLFGENTAILTLFLAGFSPLNWFYHQSIMSDNSMVTAMIAGFYYFYLWLEDRQKEKYFWYSLCWTMAAGLFKSYGLVIGAGYLLLIILRKEYQLLLSPRLYLFTILAWLPAILWIYHALGLEEGKTEFSNINQILHPELLWSWSFYKRMVLARFTDQLLTPLIAIGCVIGMCKARLQEKQYHPPIALLGACLIYLFIVQRGNFVHDYYQLPFVPCLTLFAAIGIREIWRWKKLQISQSKPLIGSCLTLFFFQSLIYTYNHARDDIGSYNAGTQIAALSESSEDKVLAFDIGANKRNQLVYYSNHKGWHVAHLDWKVLAEYQSRGVTWLGVNLLKESHFKKYELFLKQLGQKYPKVWENQDTVDRYGRPVLSQVYHLK
ncbi:MAG: glycosyltransferase family 39 protein [SAR324 cluster bacterium]|nr:glycosyltransferase family 39 protein [SAR324 cluster bacterium]